MQSTFAYRKNLRYYNKINQQEMIEIKNITHDYADFRALKSINVAFKQGEVTALVGPNGAGKTTLFKCLCGLMEPTKGKVIIDGIDVYKNPRAAHGKIGYLPDFFGLYDSLTVEQHLRYSAENHCLPANEIDEAIAITAGNIELQDKLKVKASALSRGMRQRLAIGQVLIFKPKYLILDEPASGLDPEARLSLSNLFLKLKEENISLIVSSHILAELEEYATELVVIRDGEIFSETKTDNKNIEEVNEKTENVNIYLECLRPIDFVSKNLESFDENLNWHAIKNGLSINFSADKDHQAKLLKFLVETNNDVYKFEIKEKSMQDKYFASKNTSI